MMLLRVLVIFDGPGVGEGDIDTDLQVDCFHLIFLGEAKATSNGICLKSPLRKCQLQI